MVSRAELAEPAVILAPHADDEMLGCGGWLLRGRELDARLGVAYAVHRPLERRREADEALGDFELASVLDLDLPEGRAWPEPSLRRATRRLTAWLERLDPLRIFVPNLQDPHPDHRATHQLVRGALSGWQGECLILQYEGLVPLPDADRWLDLGVLWRDKVARLRRYESQERKYELAAIADHLSAYRGRTLLRRTIRRAEAYRSLRTEEYLECLAHLGC